MRESRHPRVLSNTYNPPEERPLPPWISFLLVATATATAGIFLVAAVGARRIRRLADAPPIGPGGAPRVSVIVAARDEAAHLRAALTSLLAQRYAALEIVLVDDRSTDDTGAIADEIAAHHPALRVRHVTTLPDGWLGKNHALQAGASDASGEFLLFTDADVVFAPDAIARAMTVVAAERLDHLAVIPGITSPSRLVRWSVGSFSIFFVLFTRAWQVGNPRSSASIGIGAFNLVRTSSYRAAGRHEPIRLRPDDDLVLGRLLKRHGGRAALWHGDRTVEVDWYPSARGLVRGMEKNAYSGMNYRLWAAMLSLAGLVLHAALFTFPLFLQGAWRVVALADLAVIVGATGVCARLVGQNPLCALLQPVSVLLMAFAQTRAVALTIWRGGIEWRGTFYSLASLRGNPLP